MFDHDSRYRNLPVLHDTDAQGRTVAYISRRFLPPAGTLPVLTKLVCKEGDRLDHLAARVLGNATLFWRIADANDAIDPTDLTGTPGRELIVPVPQI
jgi:hypothetical protein